MQTITGKSIKELVVDALFARKESQTQIAKTLGISPS